MHKEQCEAARKILEDSYEGVQHASDEEILLRLQVAKEIVDDAYTKYVKKPSRTRKQAGDFCEFVILFNDFYYGLKEDSQEEANE